jgi:L-lactate dehydrogenase complex protein LldG
MTARENILARLRRAQSGAHARPAAVMASRGRGPGPAPYPDRIGRFIARARSLSSSVARVPSREQVPREVARYLGEQGLAPRLVCWPELQDLPWNGAAVTALFRPAVASDLIGVTGAFAAIAETGTLVMASGATTPPATSLLPETHIAVLAARRIVDTTEDAFELLRAERGPWPRAVNLISGPSRTADIEQTVTLGAHGPYRVHIVLVG